MKDHLTFTSSSPEDTQKLAQDLITAIAGSSAILALYGTLGTGKTCFVQGIGIALGIQDAITSPTFTLIGEYSGAHGALFHFDLYRLNGADELWSLGFDEYLEREGVVALEWAERAENTLPPQTIHLHFEVTQDGNGRIIAITNAPQGLLHSDKDA
ncbi:MAG: tRNA (adenosine(37)-N6)-threonylcarbamoyltransferase complex ATPase subunit type 1 TsaE [Verrucomicrobia bacterium]|nr:tRNA (adenosine(37)-N6)-threonylcarbamoyltransferase complex ATPase subunit type 1 TsaE [Verrucomicrobiota bacterium]